MNDRRRLTRRDFLKLLQNGLISSALLATGGVGYSALVEPGLFSVETVRLSLRRLSKSFSGLRVVQISDIHMGGWMDLDRFQEVARLVRDEHPDILLITGDFLLGHRFSDETRQALEDLTKVLSPLAGTMPCFAVLGNHDYWTNAGAVRKMLSASGVMDLTNNVFTLTRGGDKLHLCGVDDIYSGDPCPEVVVAQLDDDNAAILMAHEPDYADVSAATGKFDLQISGHTHGGQVSLPLLGPPVLPYLGRKYPCGLYKVGNMLQYTNRGVGMTRLAVRFNCRPEITLFILDGEPEA